VETLAFYSYKGGVGRSLLLANTARFLASLGRGVVALDLDFEAPGLHYKLGRAASRDSGLERMGGAVPYLLATAQGATSPPPLEEHMLDVPVPPAPGGWLRLMPAGPAPDRRYWTALKQLGEQVRFDDPSGQGLMALLDLHARIQEELKPDYLLIDARTGVTELGGLATTILADTLVCMFVANQESLDGTLTVAEAVRAAPRLKKQPPVRIVSVLARATSKLPTEGPFAAGVGRLLELGEGCEPAVKKEKTEKQKPFVLPHDEIHGAADRVIGGERTASSFSRLYKSYLELFRELFPSSAQHAQEALGRLEAVASVKRELTDRRLGSRSEGSLDPWDESAIDEGVLYESEKYGLRYADLICRDAVGRPLMVVEYVTEKAADEAKAFWEISTTARCLVLLYRKTQDRVERRIYSRRIDESDLRPTNRWDLPKPREFDLLPDVGDRSVEAMLDALRRNHVEAVAWLVRQWRESIAAVAAQGAPKTPPWRPEQARQIVDGLAATENPQLAEQILRRAAIHVPGGWFVTWSDPWSPGGEVDRWMEIHLFAPLFWRLPVEAVVRYAEAKLNPDETPCLAGYSFLADLMGLRHDPDRSALADAQALAARWGGNEHADDGEDQEPIRWLRQSRRSQIAQVHFSEDAPPLLVWEELLLKNRSRYGSWEKSQDKLSAESQKRLTATADLQNRLQQRLDRRELVTMDLLGQYDMAGRLVLYSNVIIAAAELLGVAPRYLKSVVFIHLSVRFLAHQARDLDGQPGYGFAPSPPVSPIDRESPVHVSLTQCFAHRLIQHLEDANLMAAFDKLSQYQPAAYQQWSTMQEVPLEHLRTLLLRARASAVALGLLSTHKLE
jgi:hypothetical protein